MPASLRLLNNLPNFTTQAYRYGIALSCIGVLVNWLGVAQAYIEPVRYLGVGLVIVGSFLIISAMCRWMFLTPHPSPVQESTPENAGDLHVITVPMGQSHTRPRAPGLSAVNQGKPPDYFLVAEKPPSYEEAMSMLPPCRLSRSGSLQLNAEGGLEDFLVPHQVPETFPEGATGGGSPRPQRNRSLSLHGDYQERRVNPSTPPPAYSSQMSICASPSTSLPVAPPVSLPPCLPVENIITQDPQNTTQNTQNSSQQNKPEKETTENTKDKPEKSEQISSPQHRDEKE